MALRIYVNQELENLKSAIAQAAKIIDTHGRIAVIAFHSLEDRIIKNYFKELINTNQFKFINKKTIVPK